MKRVKESQASFLTAEAPVTSTATRKRSDHRANELDGKTWTRNSISVWSDIKKSAEEAQLGHPAMFPLQLAQRLIESFTNKTDRVIFDPFVGVGTTLVAAERVGKVGIGIELSPEFVRVAEIRLAQRELFARNCSRPSPKWPYGQTRPLGKCQMTLKTRQNDNRHGVQSGVCCSTIHV